MDRERILIVEDDPQLSQALDGELRLRYRTCVARNGGDALFRAETESFDLILLDLNLPDIDGLEVAEQLADNGADILMLTARGDVESRVAGLYAGASDYLAKPFDMEELIARVHAQLRRRVRPAQLRCGPVVLAPESRTCTVRGESVDLSAQEFRLLELLVEHPGRVFSKEAITRRLYDEQAPSVNAIEVLVSRLRGKLDAAGAPELVRTIRGLGYVVPPERS